MADRPSILVLDDGELDNVFKMLRDLDLDAERIKGSDIKRRVDAPRDLLISSGRRTLSDMPEVVQPEGAGELIWVCIHNQDFLPLRERLCEMGVHYLLQNALDEDSRRRFLLQLLRAGRERRQNLRLPIGGEIEYSSDGDARTGRLVEIAVDGCRILAASPIALGSKVTASLPPSLGGGSELELSGTASRISDPEVHAGREFYPVALHFDALDRSKRERLESIIHGEKIGTRITPLAAPPEVIAAAATPEGSAHASSDPVLSGAGDAANTGAPRSVGSPTSRPAATPSSAAPSLAQSESMAAERLAAVSAAERAVAASPVQSHSIAADGVASEQIVHGPERRSQTRHDYERPVQVLGNSEPVLARDLSLSGVRLADCADLDDGAEVMVALFGAAREEPIVIGAQVVRATHDKGAGLRFGPMSPSVRESLEKLLRAQPILDALDGADANAGRTVIAELRNADSRAH